MKKKLLNSMRMLLVAAGLLVGGNAWGDSQTITLTESVLASLYPNNEVANYFDFIAMSKAWNDADTGDKATYALATGSTTIKVNNVNQYQVITPASLSMFYVQGIAGTNGFQWRWDTSKNKYGLCNFGNARTLAFAVTKGQIVVMEGGYTSTATGSCGANYAANNGYNTFTATEDGYIAFSTSLAHTRVLAILNPSASAVNYTVKYVDEGGTEIKESTEGTGDSGASITLTTVEKASFLNAGGTKKYIYKSDDSEGKTIASDGSTVVTITFREAATWGYTINAMNGETILETLANSTAFEQDNITIPFHKYYNIGGTLYTKDAISSVYKQTITVDEDNKVVGLAYTASDKTNVVFFKEAEDIETLTAVSTGGTNTRCSFAQGAYAGSDAIITNLAPGKYTLTAAGYGGNLVFKAGTTEVLNMETVGYWRENSSAEFAISVNTDITFKGGASGGGASLDYVIIQRTGDLTEVSATLPSSGFGSLASAYGLAFSAVEGLTAYAVTAANSGTVTLTAVDELPANSGVILKGTAGATYSIPVKATAAYDGTNLLGAAVSAYNCAANEVYILQGGKFHLVTAASTVPAGKAYLPATAVSSGAHALSFVFSDDETTGINNVNVNHNDNWYDLQGRRVAAPQKGLYIVNGKKVIIK